MTNNDTQPNDFKDEILVRDESGEFKVLSGDELKSYGEETVSDKLRIGAKGSLPSRPSTAVIDTGKEELALQPPPPVVRKKTASFYFHPEDEEEAAKAKPPQDLPSQKKYSLDKILAKVITSFNLTLEQGLKTRLRSVIYTYLRDRRTIVETAEVFRRSKIDGGLELKEEITARILAFLKEIKDKIVKERGLVIDERVEKEQQSLKSLPVKPKAVTEIKEQELIKVAKEVREAITAKPKVKEQPVQISSRIKRPIKKSKAAMDDIQRDYKLVGPVEELASLSLQTFRRLGSNTATQTQKVLERVNLCGKESLTKKAAGIRAWRRSPLYKMYVAIGQASMEHSLSVKEIIKQYSSQGKEIMTLEEFEAISDLNKQFRF